MIHIYKFLTSPHIKTIPTAGSKCSLNPSLVWTLETVSIL